MRPQKARHARPEIHAHLSIAVRHEDGLGHGIQQADRRTLDARARCQRCRIPEIDDLPDTDGAARTSNSGRELSEGRGRGPCARRRAGRPLKGGDDLTQRRIGGDQVVVIGDLHVEGRLQFVENPKAVDARARERLVIHHRQVDRPAQQGTEEAVEDPRIEAKQGRSETEGGESRRGGGSRNSDLDFALEADRRREEGRGLRLQVHPHGTGRHRTGNEPLGHGQLRIAGIDARSHGDHRVHGIAVIGKGLACEHVGTAGIGCREGGREVDSALCPAPCHHHRPVIHADGRDGEQRRESERREDGDRTPSVGQKRLPDRRAHKPPRRTLTVLWMRSGGSGTRPDSPENPSVFASKVSVTV